MGTAAGRPDVAEPAGDAPVLHPSRMTAAEMEGVGGIKRLCAQCEGHVCRPQPARVHDCVKIVSAAERLEGMRRRAVGDGDDAASWFCDCGTESL